MGVGATRLGQLDEYCRLLFQNKWAGVYTSDIKPNFTGRRRYAIYNLDTSRQPGSHWIAVILVSPKKILVYDSFGRKTSKIIPRGAGRVAFDGYTIIETDPDPEQAVSQSNCGQRCIAFIKTYDQLGLKYATLI